MNKVIINGNLVKDLEVRYTKNGKLIGRFTLANTVGFGDNKKTHFIPCTVFGQRVEGLQKLLLKGCGVIVEGSLDINNVIDDNANWKNYTTVIVDNVDITKFVNSENHKDYSTYSIEDLRKECKAQKLKFTYKDSRDKLIEMLTLPVDDGNVLF